MASPIQNNWSIRKLVQNTHLVAPSRFDSMGRDVIKRITIEKITTKDYKKQKEESRTTYRIRSYSYPQYAPYLHKVRGSKQRAYRHDYLVTIQLDQLSIDAPIKLRTGSEKNIDFKSKSKVVKNKVQESKNILNGINMDFFFRLEYVYAQEGILYGKCRANGPPKRTNPTMSVFLDKHALNVCLFLMKRGILK